MSNKIVFVGGGSYRWMPKLLADVNRAEALHGSEVVLLDINLAAASEFLGYGEMLSRKLGSRISHSATTSEEEAFADADFIVLTISTGGQEGDLLDNEVPRKYGSFQIIGDSAGPGGWIRTWRNAPVFIQMAQKIERLAPRAFVLNYSNPLADLTTIIQRCTNLNVLGMCHGPVQTRQTLAFLLDVSPGAIDMTYAGLNHFHWILDFTVDGRDGYEAVRERLAGEPLLSYTRRNNGVYRDELENATRKKYPDCPIWQELYEHYGHFCYMAGNHTVEFLPQYMAGLDDPTDLGIDHWWTKEFLDEKTNRELTYARELIGGESELADRSGEIVVNVIEAAVTGRPIMEVVNMVNVGQVDNLPRGFALETNGMIHSGGYTPLAVGSIPRILKNLLEPHIVSQSMLVDACLSADEGLAVDALLANPMCSYLKPETVVAMGREALEANRALQNG